MKRLIKVYLIDTVSLYLVSLIAAGISFEKGLESLLLAGAVLAIVSLLVKPLINLLLLPINLITFGLFRWVSSAITLYLVTLIVPGFRITNFAFAGFATKWFSLPALDLNGVVAYIAFSLLLSVIATFVHWVIK